MLTIRSTRATAFFQRKRILDKCAFSLFELIVSLTLMILLFASLSTIFNAGIGVYKTYDKGLAPFEEIRDIFRMIETDVLSLIPSSPGGTPSELFAGTNDTVTLVTVNKATDDTLAIKYSYNAATKQIERFITTSTSTTLPDTFPDSGKDVIGDNITSMSIHYYGGQYSGMQLTDNDSEWPSASVLPIDTPTSEMPKAIGITITIVDKKYPTIEETFTRLFAIRNR